MQELGVQIAGWGDRGTFQHLADVAAMASLIGEHVQQRLLAGHVSRVTVTVTVKHAARGSGLNQSHGLV